MLFFRVVLLCRSKKRHGHQVYGMRVVKVSGVSVAGDTQWWYRASMMPANTSVCMQGFIHCRRM